MAFDATDFKSNISPSKLLNLLQSLWNRCYKHGSHIFGLTNFHDFSSILFPFFSVLFNEFNNAKVYLTNTLQLKNQEKK